MEKDFKFNQDVMGYLGLIIISYFLILFTLGIAFPWVVCNVQKWKAKNTTIEGRQIEFVGTGGKLFGKFIVWYLLTLVTFGIYGLWAAVKMQAWMVEHQQFVGSADVLDA